MSVITLSTVCHSARSRTLNIIDTGATIIDTGARMATKSEFEITGTMGILDKRVRCDQQQPDRERQIP